MTGNTRPYPYGMDDVRWKAQQTHTPAPQRLSARCREAAGRGRQQLAGSGCTRPSAVRRATANGGFQATRSVAEASAGYPYRNLAVRMGRKEQTFEGPLATPFRRVDPLSSAYLTRRAKLAHLPEAALIRRSVARWTLTPDAAAVVIANDHRARRRSYQSMTRSARSSTS